MRATTRYQFEILLLS